MKKIISFRAAKSQRSSGERRDSVLLSRSRSAILIVTITIVALLLSACGSTSSPTPIPTVVLDSGNQNSSTPVSNTSNNNDGSVTASAIIVPVQEAQLAFSLPGSIQKVNVATGDQVKAGDLLAELENAS